MVSYHSSMHKFCQPVYLCVAMCDGYNQAIESLQLHDVPYEIYDTVAVEPTDASWKDAIAWSRAHDFSHFLA